MSEAVIAATSIIEIYVRGQLVETYDRPAYINTRKNLLLVPVPFHTPFTYPRNTILQEVARAPLLSCNLARYLRT